MPDALMYTIRLVATDITSGIVINFMLDSIGFIMTLIGQTMLDFGVANVHFMLTSIDCYLTLI